jgi:YgiT-type zinc finger domain-containing protein
MKCSIQGCIGKYENKRIVHTIQREGQVFVFEHVPAEVCSVCGDTLLDPETIRHIESLLKKEKRPVKMVPMYMYA